MNPEKLQTQLEKVNRALEKSSALIPSLRSGEYNGNPNYDLTNTSGKEYAERVIKIGKAVAFLTEKTLPFLSKIQRELETKIEEQTIAVQMEEIQHLQEKGHISSVLAQKAIENLFSSQKKAKDAVKTEETEDEEKPFTKEEIASLANLVLRARKKEIVFTSNRKWGVFNVDGDMESKCRVLVGKAFPFNDYNSEVQKDACEQLRNESLKKLAHILESGENSGKLLDGISDEIKDDANYFLIWLFDKNDSEKGEYRTLIPHILGICPEVEVRVVNGYVASGKSKTKIVIPAEFFPGEIKTQREETGNQPAKTEVLSEKEQLTEVDKLEKQLSEIIQGCLEKMKKANLMENVIIRGHVLMGVFDIKYKRFEEAEKTGWIKHEYEGSDHHQVYTPKEALQIGLIYRLKFCKISLSKEIVGRAFSMINTEIKKYQDQSQKKERWVILT